MNVQTDIDEFDAVGLDGLQGGGDVLEIVMLISGPGIPLEASTSTRVVQVLVSTTSAEFTRGIVRRMMMMMMLLLEYFDEGAQTSAVAKVLGQVDDGAPIAGARGRMLEVLVYPVSKGVGLYVDPQVLVALDGHALGGGALGRSGDQADQFGGLQLFLLLLMFILILMVHLPRPMVGSPGGPPAAPAPAVTSTAISSGHGSRFHSSSSRRGKR